MKYLLLLTFFPILASCQKEVTPEKPSENSMYFPPVQDTSWERVSISDLHWNLGAVQPLKDFLREKHSKSFMILVNGRIAMEEYFNGHSTTDTWEWNSAGKTLVAETVGIAQQEGYLHTDDKVSDYLGTGWTAEPLEKENLITIRNLLSMTSGINDESNLIIKSNLTYLADAGSRWSYSNVFQKLIDVVSAATGRDFQDYFQEKIAGKTGMEGFWNFGVIFKIYHSTTRSMARFGLLALNHGKWKNEDVINKTYFDESVHTSQQINPSYGYLWWLNGKSKYMVPGSQTVFNSDLIPNATSDVYAAMGAKDQRIYVVPGKNMVVVRMGEASNPDNPTFAVSGFDDALWQKIDAVINK